MLLLTAFVMSKIVCLHHYRHKTMNIGRSHPKPIYSLNTEKYHESVGCIGMSANTPVRRVIFRVFKV